MPAQIGYFDTLKSVAGKVFTYLASITLTGTDGKTITVTQDTALDEAVAMSSKLTIPGAWTTPVFDAGSFTALSGTWTVEAADVVTYAYSIMGKRMRVAFTIESTTITAGSERMLIKIPASKTATKTIYSDGIPWIISNGSVISGRCRVDAASTFIQILPDAGTFAGGTNNNGVYGGIEFEIN